MKLPRNSVVKMLGLMLAIGGLFAAITAKTPSRVMAEFPGQPVTAKTGPTTINPAGVAPAGTQTFCNANPITFANAIPPAGPPVAATPYPSDISVSGMTGTVTNVIVTLNNLSHTFPDDIDLLLVGPTGVNSLIMSDAGGGADAVNLTVTFDDAAATTIPDAGPLVSGTFKPSNFGAGDTFPAPAPAPSGASTLSAFNVTNPNGTWSLYAVDDSTGDIGSIAGGWCLTITTADTEPCTLTCPANITQANDPTQCAAIVSYPAPTTTGVCGTVTCSPPSGSFFFVGTTTVTCLSATGDQCSFTVTVNNVNCPTNLFCNPQTITMPANTLVTPYPSNIGVSGMTGVISKVTVTLNNLTHTFPDDIDLLLVSPTGVNSVIMSDAGGSIDANNITFTLDDAAVNSLPDAGPLVSGTFKPTNFAPADTFPAPAPTPSGATNLSVFNGTNPNGVWSLFVRDDSTGDAGSFAGGWCLDITTVNPCTITCPSNITLPNETDACGATATFSPTTTGDCGTITCSPASGTFFSVGTTTVTCTTASGPSCSFTVTVNDNQLPIVTCPANQSVTAPLGSCTATVTYEVTATDNCPGVSAVTCTPPSGSPFPVGTTTVTCTATDASSNQGSCSFTVTVTDNQNPTITCPGNQSVPATSGACSANVSYATTAADNCPGVAVACTPPSGASFPVGTTNVSCTATDASGNQASCSFTVTVTDNQNPVITCPANITTVDNAPGACGALLNPGTATATDNCSVSSVVGTRSDGQPLNALYPLGVTTITWKATDASGNMATCAQTITVTNPPAVVTITGPASGSIFPVNTSVPFTATFTDNLGDTHTAQWMFDAITQSTAVVEPTSSTPGSADLNYTFTATGVYLVSLKIVDDCGNITITNTVNGLPALVVIFDPDGEFVTGGGWINSPAGAYPANPTLTGKANFGFNAKYHNGESTPRGETQFKFGPLNFHSTSYDWLVITGAKFQFQGSGTVNGSGNYGFLLTGIDGAVSGGGGTDKFRIKIWDKNNGNAIVYDNQIGDPDSANPTTVLGGGNLVIHH